ncbi:polysaccharide deacetylase family protein [Quadrisphaera sp. DSM 44207]|uniref:polysaccharide deacetylase family protein n=1 Tax=Quadrisphaera sp. DSM 44207 TaxID=1881057 RepID=UPI00088161A5|nr:polysaccharide deacetylase family protein [Quadrisphaera sp. DSM 44207]SDQ33114.1 Polysaccharide deacetylase [Quadrisphaera sp. DSM 44207]
MVPAPSAFRVGAGDLRTGPVDPGAVRALARAVTSEQEERSGVAMYLALQDLALQDAALHDAAPYEPAGRDGAPDADALRDGREVARALAHWHALLGLDDGSDAVQHVLATLAAHRVRLNPPTADDAADDAADEPLVVLPGYAPSRPGALERVVDVVRGGRLVRVVNYHSTPRAQAEQVAADLADYAARYAPLRPGDVHRFLDTGSWGTHRPGLVVAFFDGYRNAVDVAAPACEAAGVPGWFFVPTAFLDVPEEDQRAFAATHDLDLVAEERHGRGRVAMTWDEAAALAERHVVLAHTASHTTAAGVRTPEEVRREVLEPLRRLEDVTGRRPEAFAWLGGTPFDPAEPGCAALRDAGVPLLVSGTGVERLSRP